MKVQFQPMGNQPRPSLAETEMLTLAYSRFYDLFDEMTSDSFWGRDDYYRFSKTKDVFSIYAEIQHYPPIMWVVDHLKRARPPMEAEIGSEFFAFIRNVMVHFPFFQRWEEVWISRTIVNWHKEGQSVDRFLRRYEGHEPVKYRIWEADRKKMSYVSVNFPATYTSGDQIFLKDILPEEPGVRFSLFLMRRILDTQVETP